MSVLRYLDEEYFRIQDEASNLIDTLPILATENIDDEDSLIQSLIYQNKAYGEQIITLCRTIDSLDVASNSQAHTEPSQQPINFDFIQKLQEKVKEYEALIHELSTENDHLFSQFKQLSDQVKSMHTKPDDHASGSINFESRSSHENTRYKVSSTGSRLTAGHSSKEQSLDIEHLFSSGEYHRACETLAQLEYKRPAHIPVDRFSSWLVVANKMKDNDFQDILARIQGIFDVMQSEDNKEVTRRIEHNFEDSLEYANAVSIDKMLNNLEERINKTVAGRQYARSEQGTQIEDSSQYDSRNQNRDNKTVESLSFGDNRIDGDSEDAKTREVLLKENLSNIGEELRLKRQEVEMLKERMNKLRSSHHKTGSGADDNQIVRELEEETKNRLKLEVRLQQVIDENDEVKEANIILFNESEDCKKIMKELQAQIVQKDDMIDNLMYESEVRAKEDSDQGELIRINAELKQKIEENEELHQRIVRLKDRAREPSPLSRSSPNGLSNLHLHEQQGARRNSKDTLLLESGLHMQENLIMSLKQILNQTRENLAEISRVSRISIPRNNDEKSESSTKYTVAKLESQKLLKENNIALDAIIKDANYIKLESQNILKELLTNNNDKELDMKESTTVRLQRGEEMMLGRLSECLRALGQLRAMVYSSSTNTDEEAKHVERMLDVIQDLNVDINDIIQIIPDGSSDIVSINKRDEFLNTEESHKSKRGQSSFKDQLMRDQKEIQRRLQVSLNNIHRTETDVISSRREVNDLLFNKYLEEKDLFISDLLSTVNEGIHKTNAALRNLSKLADSEDAYELVGCVLSEIEALKAQVQERVESLKTEESVKSVRRTRNDRQKLINQGDESNRHLVRVNENQERRIEDLEKEIIGLKEALDHADRDNRTLMTKTTEYFNDQRSIESFGNPNNNHTTKMIETLETENRDLKEHSRSADLALKKTHEQLSRMKIAYFSEVNGLKEEIKAFANQKQQMISEIDKREKELAQLNQVMDSVQNISSKHVETIKDKEHKLGSLLEQKKNSEQQIKELEKKVKDLTRENNETHDTESKRLSEVEQLRRDSTSLKRKLDETQEELRTLEKKQLENTYKNEKLRGERDVSLTERTESEEKIRKLNELLQVTKNELKTSRQLVEEKNKELLSFEEEIKRLRENVRKERSLNKESDFVVHLKSELRSQETEIELLKRKINDILSLNDMLQAEVQRLTNSSRKNTQHNVEPDESKYSNGDKIIELENLRQTLDRRHSDFNAGSKDSKRSRLSFLRQRVPDSLDSNSYEDRDLRKASFLSNESKHSKLSTMISPKDIATSFDKIKSPDEKDLEIKRLTNVMKDLTMSLGSYQDVRNVHLRSRGTKQS